MCDPLLLKYSGGDPISASSTDGAREPGVAPLAATNRACRIAATRAFARAARWAGAGARRCVTGLGRDRPAGGGSPGHHRIAAPSAQTGDLARPRARPADIEAAIRDLRRHLCGSYRNNGFIPTYAAFNLIGDVDLRGRELLMALTGFDSRGYKNSTLLFNLARIFIARSPASGLINPPWTGIAEPMWQPMQIRHRSAYYDAFFIEALLSFAETGLPSPNQEAAARRAIADMVDFCLVTSRERRARRRTATPSASSPRWRRCRIRASPGSSPRSSRTSASASMCRIATPPPARSRRRRKPAPTIRSSTSLCSISTPAIRSAAAPTSRPVTVPLNDNIDYDGGVVTWIDNAAGERPFGNDLDPTLNLDILEVSFRNLARWKIIETPQRLATLQRIIGFQKRPGRQRRVHRSALAHLLSAGTLLRLFRPLLRRVHGAAAGGAGRRSIPMARSISSASRVLAYVQDELIPAR